MDRATVTGWREERAEIQSKMTDLMNVADVEGRSFTKAESERFKRLDTAFRRVDGQIAAAEEKSGEARSTGGYNPIVPDSEARSVAQHSAGGSSRDGNSERDAALRTVERFTKRGIEPRAADRLDAVVRDDRDNVISNYLTAVGSEAYRGAFSKMLGDPTTGHLRFSPEEVNAVRRVSDAQAAYRALSISVDASGGFALPFELDPSIMLTSNGAENPVRDIARVITIGTNEWYGVSSDGVTASYVAEATEATDASPTLAQPSVIAAQGRAFVPFSIEFGQDWSGAGAELLKLIADGRNTLDAQKFLDGSGTNEPAGILTGLSNTQRVQTAASTTYAVGDPWSLKAAIPARFAPNTTFAAAPAVWDATYRFVGGNSTEPEQFDAGRGGNFLGRPKVEVSTMSTATTSANAKILLAGDFHAGFLIADRIGLTVELIPHLFATANNLPSGQRGLYAYWRTGSKVVNPNAFRFLAVKP